MPEPMTQDRAAAARGFIALGITIVVMAALAAKMSFEDRTLRAGLPGYTAYTRRVKYSRLPGMR